MDIFSKTTLKLPMPKYNYITTDEQAKQAITEIEKYPIYSLDTETTGLDPYLCKLTLLQIGVGNKSFVFDMRNDTDHSSIDLKTIDIILQTNQLKILQNAVFDSKVLKIKRNLYLNNMYDTMLAEQLLYLGLNVKSNLATLVYKYLGLVMDKEPRSTFQNYDQKYEPFQLEYAARDVTPLEMIRDLQLIKLKKESLEEVAELEFKFIKPMCEMELNGIHIDIEKLRVIMSNMEKEKVIANKTITSTLSSVETQTTLFGVTLINIDSNKQLKEALNKYGLQLDSTAVDALEKYSGIEIIDAILNYRKVQKLISTYGESLIEKLHPLTGRLHTHFRQMVSTGRMSSSNPNLQNMPHDQLFRSCFVAKEGYSLVTSDMSSCELCILGNLSKDKIFIEAFKNGKDLHKVAAALVFKVDYEKVTKQQRSSAKAIQFGLCYGLSKFGLAKKLKISDKQADKMIKDYFKNYKNIKIFLDRAGKDGVKYRYSTSISGRKRYYTLPHYEHKDFKTIKRSIERQSKNMVVQSANVDIIKKAMVLLCERLKPYDAKLILTVHDEVVVEVVDNQKIEVAEIVSQSMIDGFAEYFSIIPVESDSIIGPCWIKDICKCGCNEMKFINDDIYHRRLVCTKCGANQQGE